MINYKTYAYNIRCMIKHTCPKCDSILVQTSLTDYSCQCVSCKLRWKVHNKLYCMKCEYAQEPWITRVNMIIDGLGDWVECCHCGTYVHEENGTAKWVKIVEYLT